MSWPEVAASYQPSYSFVEELNARPLYAILQSLPENSVCRTVQYSSMKSKQKKKTKKNERKIEMILKIKTGENAMPCKRIGEDEKSCWKKSKEEEKIKRQKILRKRNETNDREKTEEKNVKIEVKSFEREQIYETFFHGHFQVRLI